MSGPIGDNVYRASGVIAAAAGGGAISWDTATIKTTGFTAEAGIGYFCNTTGGSFTVTLPASPTAGDMIGLKDYLNTFDSNSLGIGRNSKPIESETSDAVLQVEGDEAVLIFMDDTVGWKIVNHAKKVDLAFPTFIAATGGTPPCGSTTGDYKYHTFTGPGTFCVSATGNDAGSNKICYMIVGGGGGGQPHPAGAGGGGGAGGWRATSGACAGAYAAAPSPLTPTLTAPVPSVPVIANAYPITSAGGGSGGGGTGGSGGGTGGAGNTPPTDPPQGNPGGPGPGGGGGGIGWAAGAYGSAGGGLLSCITGSPVGYSGGSQGGWARWSPPYAPQPCSRTGIGNAGAANTGAGGSAGSGPPAPTTSGGAGGSGVVIIRYKYQ